MEFITNPNCKSVTIGGKAYPTQKGKFTVTNPDHIERAKATSKEDGGIEVSRGASFIKTEATNECPKCLFSAQDFSVICPRCNAKLPRWQPTT